MKVGGIFSTCMYVYTYVIVGYSYGGRQGGKAPDNATQNKPD